MQNTKKPHTPDEPGVFFAGETKSGFAKWQVQGAYNAEINQTVLEDFYKWKSCANTGMALELLLGLYFDQAFTAESKFSKEQCEEIGMFFKFLGALASHDQQRVQSGLDDLIQETY